MKKKPSGGNKKHLFSATEIWRRSNQLLWRWFCLNVGVGGYGPYFPKDGEDEREKVTETEADKDRDKTEAEQK